MNLIEKVAVVCIIVGSSLLVYIEKKN
jgi:hypothetical protein